MNFNPRPPCGRRLNILAMAGLNATISTHVPRAGDDLYLAMNSLPHMSFQPTSPVRETTLSAPPAPRQPPYFNPRPPCGRRPSPPTAAGSSPADFNPRPPCGRRRWTRLNLPARIRISTHVPRAGDDAKIWTLIDPSGNISTHVPRAGDDHHDAGVTVVPGIFQPTSPVRETTSDIPCLTTSAIISTHVPRAGDDGGLLQLRRRLALFQPTSPVRETTADNRDQQ